MRERRPMSERNSMRKVREVLRLKYECERSNRQIALSCRIGAGTVSEYLQRARAAVISWEDAKALSDAELETRLFQQPQYRASLPRAPIDLGGCTRSCAG